MNVIFRFSAVSSAGFTAFSVGFEPLQFASVLEVLKMRHFFTTLFLYRNNPDTPIKKSYRSNEAQL